MLGVIYRGQGTGDRDTGQGQTTGDLGTGGLGDSADAGTADGGTGGPGDTGGLGDSEAWRYCWIPQPVAVHEPAESPSPQVPESRCRHQYIRIR